MDKKVKIAGAVFAIIVAALISVLVARRRL